MGDEILARTEDELIAEAIALSLEVQGQAKDGERSSNIKVGGTTSRLTPRPGPVGSSHVTTDHAPAATLPMVTQPRLDTSQSNDSALAAEDSFLGYQRELSHLSTSSPPNTQRSSPDLGIAAETDIDPLSGTLESQRRGGDGKGSRDSPSSSPEADQGNSVYRTENITLDGRACFRSSGSGMDGADMPAQGKNPIIDSSQLAFATLSSLHEGGRELAQVWSPNKDAFELIIGMGISENAAKRALYHTGNENVELAIGWVYENLSIPELHEPFEPPVSFSDQSASLIGDGFLYLTCDDLVQSKDDLYKMTFVVNANLKMGIGKVAAQVGHAVLGLYHKLQSKNGIPGLAEWERNGGRKVVLKGLNAAHLLDLKQKAVESGIVCLVVQDAGKTQVEPGSFTVLGLFGQCKLIDALTEHLKLL